MRILLVSHVRKDPDAGSSRVYHLLEEGLAARGHFVKTLHYDDFQIPRGLSRVATRFFLPHAASRRAAQEPLNEFDVIMSSSGMLYPLFRTLRKRSKRPLLVSHLHGLSYFDHQAIMTEVMRGHMSVSWVYRHVTGPRHAQFDFWGSEAADLTIVQNGRDMDGIQDRVRSQVISIPLCVHPEILEAGAKAPRPEERPPASLVWFGSWVERKGIHYLPRALKQIMEHHPETTLTVGGTGLSEQDLKRFFAPELHSRITVLPRISRAEQIEIFSRSAIFLFPSISEGFGFALLEAMALGLAAVTTHTGMGVDYLLDRENAMIIPQASALHLARAVSALIEHNDLRCAIAAKGRDLALSFTPESFIDAYESAFVQYSAAAREGYAGPA